MHDKKKLSRRGLLQGASGIALVTVSGALHQNAKAEFDNASYYATLYESSSPKERKQLLKITNSFDEEELKEFLEWAAAHELHSSRTDNVAALLGAMAASTQLLPAGNAGFNWIDNIKNKAFKACRGGHNKVSSKTDVPQEQDREISRRQMLKNIGSACAGAAGIAASGELAYSATQSWSDPENKNERALEQKEFIVKSAIAASGLALSGAECAVSGAAVIKGWRERNTKKEKLLSSEYRRDSQQQDGPKR